MTVDTNSTALEQPLMVRSGVFAADIRTISDAAKFIRSLPTDYAGRLHCNLPGPYLRAPTETPVSPICCERQRSLSRTRWQPKGCSRPKLTLNRWSPLGRIAVPCWRHSLNGSKAAECEPALIFRARRPNRIERDCASGLPSLMR